MLLSLVALVCCSLPGSAAQALGGGDDDNPYLTMKSMVQKDVDLGRIRYDAPRVIVKDGQMRYQPPELLDRSGDWVLDAQYTVAIYRRELAKRGQVAFWEGYLSIEQFADRNLVAAVRKKWSGTEQARFWEPFLQKVEIDIKNDYLYKFNNPSSRLKMNEGLYLDLKEIAEAEAKKFGLTVDRDQVLIQPMRMDEIGFRLVSPKGGQIRYIPIAAFTKAKVYRTAPKFLSCSSGGKVELVPGAVYRCYTIYPDNTVSKSYQDIKIPSDSEVLTIQ